MESFKINDRVSVLDDDMEGLVTAVNANEITVETTDGFLIKYTSKELIKLGNSSEFKQMIAQNPMQSKMVDVNPPKKQNVPKFKTDNQPVGIPEFDLHIEKLVKNKGGMTNYDILTLQSETAKRHIEFAIKNRIPKIVFIHGVGEGVLKAELDFLLGRYENISFQDANYQKYGLGATEVYLKQSAF
ncbi:MAG: dsDNA-specific endonuclease/ATPase MutS2 [Flavobacterium sp.]|jgi:dsDNA-specific endonuclease/ATPase MutS2